ncbi:Ku protein [Fervidibacillus halotolerans]|uniref:Non-homologous end joining protein Ku n=1 Tax=Fervidibacillus halotolerans TaxID=2980027 RepID=A0A9E8M1L7_9BACI|nr:Ku protein [Fervidibacillus halotolerans]WAA13297.1 Ku protein [Fervidibacillus halotolerans]
MHTVWKGSIRFGLVNIPVKLHTATEDKDISFRNLHEKCHTPIKYEKICPNCDVKVSKEEIVKGYEYAKGKFIVIEEDELKNLEKEMEEKAVEILDFVKITDIDPIYFKRSYFLSPNEGGVKPYILLRKAMEESKKVGIAKITIRAKEQLAILRVYQNTLIMETIFYPDEVKKATDVPNVPTTEQISKKELDTAILLIDQLTSKFQPEKYKDEYREAILNYIERKRIGKETVTPTPKREAIHSDVTDLMAALQASIDRTGSKKDQTVSKKGRKTTKEKRKA